MSVPDTIPSPITSPPMVDASAAHDTPSVRPWLRVLVPLIALPIIAYSVGCLIYNAPASAARVRLIGPIVRLMPSYFGQDWELFAPTPPTENDLLYMDVELQRANSQQVLKTPQVEIEQTIDSMPRSDRLNPTKLPGVMLAIQEGVSRYVRQANDIKNELPKANQGAAMEALTKDFQPEFEELRRFLSARASSMYPHDRIIAVRGTFKTRAIVPFSSRYQRPSPHQPAKSLLETSWMAFAPGVVN